MGSFRHQTRPRPTFAGSAAPRAPSLISSCRVCRSDGASLGIPSRLPTPGRGDTMSAPRLQNRRCFGGVHGPCRAGKNLVGTTWDAEIPTLRGLERRFSRYRLCWNGITRRLVPWTSPSKRLAIRSFCHGSDSCGSFRMVIDLTWVKNADARNPWDDDWLVIGDQGGDA